MSLENSCFLFDIDGTLVDLHHLWEKAYRDAYQQLTGVTLQQEEYRILFSNPDLVGHKIILEKKVMYTPEAVLLLARGGQKLARENFAGDLTSYVLPGVQEILSSLSAEQATLATATGNTQNLAELILQNSGLRDYFSLMGCAEENTKSKAEIVERVLQNYTQQGKIFDKWKTYMIGDTPSDIRAAQGNGIVSIAVATGYFSSEELAKEKPDYVLKDLREMRGIIWV